MKVKDQLQSFVPVNNKQDDTNEPNESNVLSTAKKKNRFLNNQWFVGIIIAVFVPLLFTLIVSAKTYYQDTKANKIYLALDSIYYHNDPNYKIIPNLLDKIKVTINSVLPIIFTWAITILKIYF